MGHVPAGAAACSAYIILSKQVHLERTGHWNAAEKWMQVIESRLRSSTLHIRLVTRTIKALCIKKMVPTIPAVTVKAGDAWFWDGVACMVGWCTMVRQSYVPPHLRLLNFYPLIPNEPDIAGADIWRRAALRRQYMYNHWEGYHKWSEPCYSEH